MSKYNCHDPSLIDAESISYFLQILDSSVYSAA